MKKEEGLHRKPFISAPEQKDSPVPVMIATCRFGSLSNHSHNRCISALVLNDMQLRCFGRFIVRSSICGAGKETKHP